MRIDQVNGAASVADDAGKRSTELLDEGERLLSLATSGRYWEVFGFSGQAEVALLKTAYFQLLRRFHPDRLRADLPPAEKESLVRVTAMLNAAFERLSTQTARSPSSNPRERARPSARRAPSAGQKAPPRREHSIAPQPEPSVVAAGRERFVEMGRRAAADGHWASAVNAVKSAQQCDPGHLPTQRLLEEYTHRLEKTHSERFAGEARQADAAGDSARAAHLYERAARGAKSAELYARAASCAISHGSESRKAVELAREACRLQPNDAAFQRLLARAYEGAGLDKSAASAQKQADALERPRRSSFFGRLRGK